MLLIAYFFIDKSIMLIMFALSFLEKVPREYFCTYEGKTDVALVCVPEDFCNDPTVTSYKPNMALSDSYENWVGRFDLECASKAKVGLIGSAYFIGWIITLIFIPRISDLYGREKYIKMSNVV